jgi:hypothetical protein
VLNIGYNKEEPIVKNKLIKKTISLLACVGLAPLSYATDLATEAEKPINVEQALENYKDCNSLTSTSFTVDLRNLLQADNRTINLAIADITETTVGTVTTSDLTENNTVPVKPICIEEIPDLIREEIIIRDLIHGRDVDSTGMCMRIGHHN